jgi:membrane-associated phospholipid phosphatase
MRDRIARHLPGVLMGLLLLPLAAASAHGQRTLRTIGRDLGHGIGDMLYVWSSPVRADRYDWLDAALVGGAVLLFVPADWGAQRWMVEHPSSVVMDAIDPFREGRKPALVDLGSPKQLLPLAGALYVVGFVADSRAIRDAAVGCTSAQQAQAGIQTVALHIVQRERPLTADGDPYDMGWGVGPWDRHSFYSGHMSTIMSCVTYWNERFHMGWVEPALYTLAVGIGLGRMADQRHWASDIAAGTVLGYAVGRTVGRRARRRADQAQNEATKTGVLDGAYLSTGAGGVTAGWRRAF